MRSLSLKDIIEYIAAAVVIIFAFFIVAILYALFNIESYSEYTYQQFTNSLLIDRLNYCLYEDTGNPLLLFYAPNPNIINEYNNVYQQCFMNISGTLDYFTNESNQSNEVIYTYLNFSYDDYIYFFFYDINNISNSYSYDPYNLSFENDINVNPYYVAYNIYNVDYTYENLPSLNQFLINYFYNYSLYIYNETEYMYQNYQFINNTEILNSTATYGTVYYTEVYIQPIASYYITLPEYDSGEPVIVSLYGVGNLYMNGIYNETCNIIAGGQINISSCKITQIQ
ncbi:hypothetical protein [Candidatus Nanobsidianus stetteri]|uniref:Uncharacterized protein n=1 Tax=Nanobsidianus stetteri TaxID=1294122 RepID=A0A2T9WLE5_NANST|nr:hypothetical protein [Candidatus Nanobsidianus stetteri]MCC5447195.1 hypothetical protein [Candidatus Nanobsidianus stetteri]